MNLSGILGDKETSVCGLVIALAALAKALGWIGDAAFNVILGIFGPAGLFLAGGEK